MEENDPDDSSQKPSTDDQKFWQALKPDLPPRPTNNAEQSGSIDISGDALQQLNNVELVARRDALRSMLASSEARQQDAVRSRRPSLAIGQSVLVRSSDHSDRSGIVLDADFIHSRALIKINDTEEPQWYDFMYIGALPEND